MSNLYESDAPPTPEEAERLVKRLSSGFGLCDTPLPLSPRDDKSLKIAIFSLQKYLKDLEFATEYLDRGGLQTLCDIILNFNGNTLAYALSSLTSIMEHDMGWDSLSPEFIEYIAHIVVSEQLATIGRPAIAILLKLVCANKDNESNTSSICCYGFPVIYRSIQQEPDLITSLADRLQSQDYTLCVNSLSLLVALLKYVPDEHRSELSNAYDNSNLRKNVMRLINTHPSDELKELLLEYQRNYIKNIVARLRIAVSVHNPHHVKLLRDIWKAANVDKIHIPGASKWKKIGFSSESPQREFGRTGLFGLDQMHYYVMKDPVMFSKLIVEQIHRPEGKCCPFAKASAEVTDILCSYWNISSMESLTSFHQLILSFNAVHSTTLQTYFRIFHDMEATTHDFSKVSALVRSQLRAALNNDSVKDIQEFDRTMFGTPYQVIRDRRLKELEWADDLLGRDAISNLRTRLSKQSYEFLKKQRIGCLLEGAWFPSPLANHKTSNNNNNHNNSVNSAQNTSQTTNGSPLAIMSPTTGSSTTSFKRWRYYKLSRSKKCLMYGDFSEKIAPVLKSYGNLYGRIELSQVKEIKTISKPNGYSHSSMANSGTADSSGSSSSGKYLFALYSDNNTVLAEFVCANATQAADWKDGFSMLIDDRFISKETAELFHTLTEVGVKVKLLQIAGDRIEVPHGNIEIPPVPTGLGSGFFYDYVES
ncbi:ELMO/CED-12 family-domain-containing protein [Pilobolus umbonatus]|nr:ELMO/CED-12 family-domain-containing protein [Pilobolus umbonatus]